MSNGKVYYVQIERRWKERSKRWETSFFAGDERPLKPHDLPQNKTIAIFEVERAPSANVACAIVAEWLYKGKPDTMTVKEMFLP